MRELHRAFVTEDRFVDLLAGLHVWCERFDALLARDAIAIEPVPAGAVDALLGLVALRRKLATTLAASARPVDPARAPAAARESLLR
ncbi:MAG: hypothetical protein ABI678_30575 [Kofleriaceae bacterium]